MAPSTAEVGAVITELENEYQRSKKFVEDLYRSLEPRRLEPDTRPGECLNQSLQVPGTLQADTKEAAVFNPFSMFQLTEEDSEMSNCSEASTSVPRLPDLRLDGNIPNSSQPPAHMTTSQRREDNSSAMTSSSRWKNPPLGITKKPSAVTYNSCPNVESTQNDDFLGGAFEGYLQMRPSNGVHGLPISLAHVEGLAIAQVLSSTPAHPPVVRHRRSSLDFIPAPQPHMRKWSENALATCTSVPASSQEAACFRSHQQISKRGSGLEVFGSNATAPTHPPGPLSSSSSSQRPTYVPPPHRRLSSMSYGAASQPQQMASHMHEGPLQAVSVTVSGGVGSPTPPTAGGSGGTGMGCSSGGGYPHVVRTVVEAGGQLTIAAPGSPGASSPSYLPPLQPSATSPAGPTSAAGAASNSSSSGGGAGAAGGGVTARSSMHASLDVVAGSGGTTIGGRMGSWSGVPLQTSGSSSGGETGHSNSAVGEKPRTARFARRGLAYVAGSAAQAAVATTIGSLAPTPPPEPDRRRDRPRRLQGTADNNACERRPSSHLAPLAGPNLHGSCAGGSGSAERSPLAAGASAMSAPGAGIDVRLPSEPAAVPHYRMTATVGGRQQPLQQSCPQTLPVSVGRSDACIRRQGAAGLTVSSRVG